MQPHQQRVIDEKSELDAKLERLTGFIGGSIFQSLAKDEQDRLRRQEHIMRRYSAVLAERISAF